MEKADFLKLCNGPLVHSFLLLAPAGVAGLSCPPLRAPPQISHKKGVTKALGPAGHVHVEQKRTLVATAFLGHWPITKVDLHSDHVSEHVLFSRLREAKTTY